MKTSYYTFFFWIIWVLLTPFFLKIIPDGWELIYIITYSMAGLGLYFAVPSVFMACFDKIREKKYQKQRAIEQNKKLFLKEQYLRKKYRYIKINNKDNIINSDIIDTNDKILLLRIIHNCSPEGISRLLKKGKP